MVGQRTRPPDSIGLISLAFCPNTQQALQLSAVCPRLHGRVLPFHLKMRPNFLIAVIQQLIPRQLSSLIFFRCTRCFSTEPISLDPGIPKTILRPPRLELGPRKGINGKKDISSAGVLSKRSCKSQCISEMIRMSQQGGLPRREGTDEETGLCRQRPGDRTGRGGEQGLGETEIQNQMQYWLFQTNIGHCKGNHPI